MHTNQDWEHEAQKDAVYLQEELKEIERAILQMIAKEQKKEAKISVIPPGQKENLQNNDEHKVLPF